MLTDFEAELNKIYVFDKYTILYLMAGQGIFQVDFQNYTFQAPKAIFLSPGQYFQLLVGKFNISTIAFNGEVVSQFENSRYLFKHLVGLGHIEIDKVDHQPFTKVNDAEEVLTNAINNWLQLNPFGATNQQVNLLFDFVDHLEKVFPKPLNLIEFSKNLQEKPKRINLLFQEKLNRSVNGIITARVLLETKRRVVFTNQSTKEIAFEVGFNDPAYFNRFFKKQTSKTPTEFREDYSYRTSDPIINDLYQLINSNYFAHHFAEYYADQLALSIKTLSRRVHEKLGTSVKQLINQKLIEEGKKQLQLNIPIVEIAFDLGFKEPNHFMTFFKKQTGKTPTQFLLGA